MKTTWKPLVTGILEIVAGSLSIILGCGLYMSYRIATLLTTVPPWINTLLTYPILPLVLLGVSAVIAGVFAVQHKKWGLVLAGSIAAFLVSPLLGIFAIIFAAISKKEFI